MIGNPHEPAAGTWLAHSPPPIEQSAAYIAVWGKQLKGDKRPVVAAAGSVDVAGDMDETIDNDCHALGPIEFLSHIESALPMIGDVNGDVLVCSSSIRATDGLDANPTVTINNSRGN